jgi:nitrilase/aliphatic nitrilase
MDDLVMKAKEKGADIVVFGEAFVSAFPLWNMVYAPVDQHEFFRSSSRTPLRYTWAAPEDDRGGRPQRTTASSPSGINEKGPISMGAMWNTNLLFDREGRLLSKHQKLVPTGRRS